MCTKRANKVTKRKRQVETSERTNEKQQQPTQLLASPLWNSHISTLDSLTQNEKRKKTSPGYKNSQWNVKEIECIEFDSGEG